MKASRNAFVGYTYQEQITLLFLVMMDVNRKFDSIEIEANVENNFDDIKISKDGDLIYFQIKDFDQVSLNDLTFSEDHVLIKKKKHSLADDGTNVIVFKNIAITPNCEFHGLPSLKQNNTYIISLSRVGANDIISNLYEENEKRRIIINKFFFDCLDNRVLLISKKNLPIINFFDTQLIEETINVGKRHLEFSNILFIEGKPGVGKSHYVSTLSNEYRNNIVYRFWVSNQDKEYKSRLVYGNFLFDINKKLFGDYVTRSETEIISKLEKEKIVVIIDGLDHVENYNSEDLKKFIEFIDLLSQKCKTIVLSRPLKRGVSWEKQVLADWNEKQTRQVLTELYHITDNEVKNQIYELTHGYPILVRFISEHQKEFNDIPPLHKLKSTEDYYDQILKDVNVKSALSLFLTSRSFFMKSELGRFLPHELLDCVEEFIDAYPYLFEVRLNRISLFHDSLNKYLREQNVNFSKRKEDVNKVVFQSLICQESRFMSRFTYFDLDKEMKLKIIKKFSSIELFREIAKNCIDFEAIRAFYFQAREEFKNFSHGDFEIKDYYDLSLIINIVTRDHISTLNEFLYTYSKSLTFNGYSIEDITSSEYLFAMIVYIEENDSTLLYNVTSDQHYNTERFLENLEYEIRGEETFFSRHEKQIILKKPISFYLKQSNWKQYLVDILTNLYLFKSSNETLLEFQNCIDTFLDVNETRGIRELERIFYKYNIGKGYYANWVLNDVRKELLSLGRLEKENQYLKLSLKDYILQNRFIGSFELWRNILSYLRLSLERKKKNRISDIGLFWCMYYNRKDYTVFNLPTALQVFEDNGLVEENDSIEKVVFTQSMSEKGIRHLLTDYISNHPPEIIYKVLELFDLHGLNISWFNLPAGHIDSFPDRLYNYASNSLLDQNRYNNEVDFNELENVFYSSKWSLLLKDLKFLKYKIRIAKDAKEINKLNADNISLVMYEEDNRRPNSSSYRYNKGILGITDKPFIIKNKLSPTDISGYLNGNYVALEDVAIFEIYPKSEISENLKEIIHNAFLGKVNSLNSFGSLYFFLGNLPKLVDNYGEKAIIKELHKSFDIFMELSLLNKPYNS